MKLLSRLPMIRFANPKQITRDFFKKEATRQQMLNTAAQRIILMNEALSNFITKVYECDHYNHLINFDARSNRIMIPVPWGSRGHRHWGLTRPESYILRAIMFRRQDDSFGRPPLFYYVERTRSWALNYVNYQTIESAMYWLRACKVRIEDYRMEIEK